ncbi:MAG: nucleoside hydrolase [Acidobacteriia bacterium]|nr:nucleoside hydrolase [Terriglobia bacterium]
MQFPGQGKPPAGVVFDSDMGNSIDDALALALLYGLDGKNEARVISVSVSKSNLKAAAFSEVIGRFYAGAVSGDFGAVGRTLPVGMATTGWSPEDTPMLTVPLSRKADNGKPVYAHGIEHLNNTAEVSALIRNAFSSQHDQNCMVVLTGPATNLAGVLRLPGVKDLIAAKVRYLCLMGGAFPGGMGPDGQAEYNIKADIPAAKKLFAEWPTPIIASGVEIGSELLYPAASIENDFSWTQAHPVVDAYRAYQTMPYDTPTWDLTAVLYAVRPKEGYFKLSDPGRITVGDDGRTSFSPAADGKHRYLILDPAQKERILKTYVELTTAKPVVRRRFRRPPEQQKPEEKKAETPKPAETKP